MTDRQADSADQIATAVVVQHGPEMAIEPGVALGRRDIWPERTEELAASVLRGCFHL